MPNILVIAGSPRKNSNTGILADAFILGAEESGNSVKKITLRDLTIRHCLACDHCRKLEGRCVLKDDMHIVYEALKEADILVLASPLHFYTFSTQMKAVIDRLYNKPLRDAMPVRETVLLAVCADEKDAFAPLIATYRAIGNFLGWKDRGIIAVPEIFERGEIAEHPALEEARKLGKSILGAFNA